MSASTFHGSWHRHSCPWFPNSLRRCYRAYRPALATRLEQQAAREQTDHSAEANKAQWAQLAAECEAEIKRRANDPGSCQAIIRQLASELKLPTSFLQTILRVSRREQKADKRKVETEQYRERKAQILRLKFAVKSSSEIAAAIGISARQVNNYLADAAGKPRAAKRTKTEEPST